MTVQATVLAPVYPSMRSEELGRFLREAGYDIELVENHNRPTYRMLSEPRFMIRLLGALEKRPGEYHSICVQFWRSDLTRVLQVVRDSQGKSEGWRLN